MKFTVIKNHHVAKIDFTIDGHPYTLEPGKCMPIPKDMLATAVRGGRLDPMKASYIREVHASELSAEDVKRISEDKRDVVFVETKCSAGFDIMFDGVMYTFEKGKKYLLDNVLAKKLISRSKYVTGSYLNICEMEKKEEPEVDPDAGTETNPTRRGRKPKAEKECTEQESKSISKE